MDHNQTDRLRNYIIHLSSNYVINSSSSNFTTQLSKPLTLNGNWTCSLIKFSYPKLEMSKLASKPECIFICTDICEDSFVGNSNLPYIAIDFIYDKKKNKAMTIVDYMIVLKPKIRKTLISHIKMYISDENGKILSFQSGEASYTLLLEQHIQE